MGNGKVHYYPYSKEFTLETDQKPLVSIYKKHMVDISPRVQRLIVRSFPYLPFKVVYKKEKDIPVADALSHVTPMDSEDNIQLPIIAVNMITTQCLMSEHSSDSISNRLAQLGRIHHRRSTSQDSKATLTLTSCVTEKTCRQIFQSFGLTRNHYTTNLDSLIMGTRS